jgi:hypothetical protein
MLCRGRPAGRLRLSPAASARPLTASLAETAGFDDSPASTSRISSEGAAAVALEAPAADVFAFLGVGTALVVGRGAAEAAAETRRDDEREGVPGVASGREESPEPQAEARKAGRDQR